METFSGEFCFPNFETDLELECSLVIDHPSGWHQVPVPHEHGAEASEKRPFKYIHTLYTPLYILSTRMRTNSHAFQQVFTNSTAETPACSMHPSQCSQFSLLSSLLPASHLSHPSCCFQCATSVNRGSTHLGCTKMQSSKMNTIISAAVKLRCMHPVANTNSGAKHLLQSLLPASRMCQHSIMKAHCPLSVPLQYRH